jgi:hypothetical protein
MARLRGARHKGGERVADSVKALMTSLVEVPTTLEGQPAIFATQLLGATTRTIDEDSPHALLLYSFPDALRKIIQDSRYWGRIKSHVMFAFTSKYALALYEAVCLRGNLRVCEQGGRMPGHGRGGRHMNRKRGFPGPALLADDGDNFHGWPRRRKCGHDSMTILPQTRMSTSGHALLFFG